MCADTVVYAADGLLFIASIIFRNMSVWLVCAGALQTKPYIQQEATCRLLQCFTFCKSYAIVAVSGSPCMSAGSSVRTMEQALESSLQT